MEKRSALIQSVERACDILDALCAAGGEATLHEISARVALSKSTAHGLLATLHSRGLVSRTSASRYTLGLRLFELGNAAVARLDLRGQAGQVLRGLLNQFQETVNLVTLDGSDLVCIDKVETTQSMRIVSKVGSRLPAACTGVGKAILAHLPSDHVERLLQSTPLKPWTRNSIIDKDLLRGHLAEIKRCGYAIDDEEIVDGLRCVAAPIFDHRGGCVGALSISGPSARMAPARLEEMIPAVCDAGQEVSRRLGLADRRG